MTETDSAHAFLVDSDTYLPGVILETGQNNFTFSLTTTEWTPSPGILLAIGIYMTLLGVAATIGNILFILVVTRWKLMRNNCHMILLLNLAICDLAISFVGYPYTTISGYWGSWPFGDVICVLYGFLCFTFNQVSMNIMVAVSIFRYITICHTDKQHYLTNHSSWMTVCGCWCYALCWTVPPLIGWSSYTFEPTGVSCSLNWQDRTPSGIGYTLGCLLFCYVTHVCTLITCYSRIFHRVHNLNFAKTQRQAQNVSARKESVSHYVIRCEYAAVFSYITDNLAPLEVHILRMNVTMVTAFLVCWTPYAVVSLVSIFQPHMSPIWYIFPTMFAKMSCMMNPIVYGLTNRYLRKELRSVARKFLRLTTPLEDFQLMRKKQQEALYDKNGIYTGKIHHSCTCEKCVDSRRQMFSDSDAGKNRRTIIDEFVKKQKELDVMKEKAEEAKLPKTSTNETNDDEQSQVALGEVRVDSSNSAQDDVHRVCHELRTCSAVTSTV